MKKILKIALHHWEIYIYIIYTYMSVIERINQMIRRPSNVVFRIPLQVESYEEVMQAWLYYKRNGQIFQIAARKIVQDVFAFHQQQVDHIILYYSVNLMNCLLMCRVGNTFKNLLIPAPELLPEDYGLGGSIIATYT